MRVLIADDNADLAESIAAVLRARGSETRVALDGPTAIATARAWLPDVLLVDLKLPGCSGLEVIDALRRADSLTRILAMTGYDTAERIESAERIGAEIVLRKPFSMPALLASLDLEHPSAESEAAFDGRVAVLLAGSTSAASERVNPSSLLPAGCVASWFSHPEELREAVGDGEFDAVLLLRPELVEELTTDLAHLDPDLAVVPIPDRALLESAVRQTRVRRRTGDELLLLRAVVRDGGQALLLLRDAPPRVRFWSAALQALLGYRDDELTEQPLSRLEEELVVGPLHALVAQARASGALASGLATVRLRGGAVRRFAVTARAGSGGERAPVALLLSDVDDGGRHHDDLRLLGATAAGVAHEMRNALASVGNSLTVLKGRVAEDAAVSDVVGRVLDRVARANEVMNDLLDFARPVTLRLLPIPAKLVLDGAVESLLDTALPGVRIVCEPVDPSLRILVDPVRLQMALVNLGNNAAQVLAEIGGTVTLSCTRDRREVHIRVVDDGPGVPEPIRDRIFDPFFTTRPRGSGLGLANVRKLIEAHGGRIRLLPDGPGAHFEIVLPRRPDLHGENA